MRVRLIADDGRECLTATQVVALLKDRHRVANDHAQAIMDSGLVGVPIVDGGKRFYPASTVGELVGRANVDHEAVVNHGLLADRLVFVARVRSHRKVDERSWIGWKEASKEEAAQQMAVGKWWTASERTVNEIERTLEESTKRGLSIPFVCTVGGVVAGCWDGVKVQRRQGQFGFELTRAGPWAADFEAHWLRTRPGSVWTWHDPNDPYVRSNLVRK